MVAVWVDPAAHDETAVRHACRARDARRDRGVRKRAHAAAVQRLVDERDSLASPFYHGD